MKIGSFPHPWLGSKFALTALAASMLAVLAACGGSSSSSSFGGGGGGGGGSSSPACTQPSPVTVAAQGKAPVNPETVTFTNLHMGGLPPDLPWPAGSNGQTLPFGGLRLWDTGTGWAEVNTASGVYDFTTVNNFEAAAEANGIDLIYNLARTPNFISSNPNDDSCSYDTSNQGGPGQCDPPSDLNADGSGTDKTWIAWVTAAAINNTTSQYGNTYGNRIKFYEIWNEWNIPLFWTGTPQQLARMEQDARCVIEGPPTGFACNSNSVFPSGTGLDPNARIITPAPVGAGTSSSQLAEVSTQLASYFSTQANGSNAHGGAFADIIGFHGYVGSASKVQSTSPPCPIPENVTTVLGDLYSTVQANQNESYAGGKPKPWFDTEDGWSKAQDEGFNDPDRQAAFLARYFLLQWSMGVDRMYWYRWDGTSTYGGALWSPADGPIEAVTAWQQVAAWMNGASISSCTPNPSTSVWSCSITRPGGYQALAVWDPSQDCVNGTCTTSSYNIPSGPGYTQYQDIAGNTTSIGGSTSVSIGAKPILLETGNP